MVPRPRNKANKNLPQNLYFDSRRSTSVSYTHLTLPTIYSV